MRKVSLLLKTINVIYVILNNFILTLSWDQFTINNKLKNLEDEILQTWWSSKNQRFAKINFSSILSFADDQAFFSAICPFYKEKYFHVRQSK